MAIHLDGVAIDELDVTFFDCEFPASQALVFFLAIAVDDFVLLLNKLAKIQTDLRWVEPWITRMACIVDELRRFDQVFRRQTTTVHAGSADHAFFGHRRGFAQLLCPQRRGKGCGARAKDDEVVVVRLQFEDEQLSDIKVSVSLTLARPRPISFF
jgi:hypothetical protein